MQFKTLVVAALASVASACSSSSEAGSTCLTSGGAWLYIVSPFVNQSYTAGGQINLEWDVCGSDAAFSNATVSFSLVDATNSNDAADIANGDLVFSTPVKWSAGQATGTIPSGISGSKISVKSNYRDAAVSKWDYCFGNTFVVVSDSTSPTTNSSTASSSGVSTIGKSSAESIAASAAVAVVAALLL
ncbi:hypothetical protein HK100_000074 [Physocladia obscura]|uniref:Uncharacterized protein n=1 Tax=Physocladia obscura TaxID=109957 RepID=A0AAD5T0D1_9FUNG|nr:hypothetical protein HK100_000074 [Physocladia obscura]